jgi:hypothetical protein
MKEPAGDWFVLRPQERLWVASILAIFLLGLLARHLHLRRLETAAPAEPFEIHQEP